MSARNTVTAIQVFLLFVMPAVLILPAHGSLPSMTTVAVPAWSDNLGNSSNVMAACSEDCSFIAAGTWSSNLVRMYDRTGKILWTYRAEKLYVMDVAIAGDGETVAAGFYNAIEPDLYGGGEIVCFDRSGNILWRYGTNATVHRLAVSDDGSRIFASGNSDVCFFDRNGTLLNRTATGGAIWAVALSGDGTLGVAGAGYPKSGFYAMHPDGTPVMKYPGGPRIGGVAISRDGSAIAAADSRTLDFFSGNGTFLWNFTKPAGYTGVAVSSDGEYLAASSQYYLRYLNRIGDLLWTYQDPGYVRDVAITGSGDTVFAAGDSGIFLFDRTGRALWSNNRSAGSVSAARTGDYFAAGTSSEILLFNRDGSATLPPGPVDTQGSSAAPETPETPAASLSGAGSLCGLVCAFGIVLLRRKWR